MVSLQLLRNAVARSKRPWTAAALTGGATLTTVAVVVEWRAQRLEQQGLLQGLPRSYDWDRIRRYYYMRPISVVRRFAHIAYEITPCALRLTWDFGCHNHAHMSADEKRHLHVQHAAQWREALTNLGPAFVKAGQQLSIRPDLVPPAVLQELQKLCDAVRPVPDEVAFQVMREELHVHDLTTVYKDLQLVASASLGQVYKARLCNMLDHNDDDADFAYVAVKVQRPHMRRQFSLDLFLLQKLGGVIDAFTTTFTNQPPFHQKLYESFAAGSYAELDYVREADNQDMFRREFHQRKSPVVVPRTVRSLCTERVLTSEWIEGVKLADSSPERIRELIPVGVELFLMQLLDIGTFHADPHVGNLVVTQQGKLCLLDFGLCAEVDEQARHAMTKAIVHLLLRDFDSLVGQDVKDLGFLPHDYDTTELQPLLTKILTVGIIDRERSDFSTRKRKLLEISNELNEVFFRYPFTVPPFAALITRGLTLLEGIALTGDPDFDIFRASVPYARKCAVGLLGKSSLRQLRRLSAGAANY